MTDEKQPRHEHTLEWIVAGLVAFFIFAAVVFYSFSVDVRSVSASPTIAGGQQPLGSAAQSSDALFYHLVGAGE